MGRLKVFCFLFLSSCSIIPPKVEIKEVYIPQMYCPAPPTVKRPELLIYNILDIDTAGDVAVKYKLTIEQLLNYSNQLETVIKYYQNISNKKN